jgi:hypothetical protein
MQIPPNNCNTLIILHHINLKTVVWSIYEVICMNLMEDVFSVLCAYIHITSTFTHERHCFMYSFFLRSGELIEVVGEHPSLPLDCGLYVSAEAVASVTKCLCCLSIYVISTYVMTSHILCDCNLLLLSTRQCIQ